MLRERSGLSSSSTAAVIGPENDVKLGKAVVGRWKAWSL